MRGVKAGVVGGELKAWGAAAVRRDFEWLAIGPSVSSEAETGESLLR